MSSANDDTPLVSSETSDSLNSSTRSTCSGGQAAKSEDALGRRDARASSDDVWRLATIFLFIMLCVAVLVIALLLAHRDRPARPQARDWPADERADAAPPEPLIFVITPTYARPERLADLTMVAQALMHVRRLRWLVVEDGGRIAEPVQRLLQRTGLDYTYFAATTPAYLPKRGWAQRNAALAHLRAHYAEHAEHAVVYFADDDNSYDRRVFDLYVRRVKRLGVWAVGLAATTRVEAPQVRNGTVTGWDVVYRPHRRYATDMAGFAISLKLIVRSRATFGRECVGIEPEDCFLRQVAVPLDQLEPFGWDAEPKDVLVWHTKTVVRKMKGDAFGYVFEEKA